MWHYRQFVLATVCLAAIAACSTVEAKHRYFANVHPATNYLHRCLGIGWSDGYHAQSWQPLGAGLGGRYGRTAVGIPVMAPVTAPWPQHPALHYPLTPPEYTTFTPARQLAPAPPNNYQRLSGR